MMRALLTLNTGSSSIKFRLYGLTDDLPFLLGGKVTDIGGHAEFQVHTSEDKRDEKHTLPTGTTHATALDFVLHWLSEHRDGWELSAAAHRIVHGGTRYADSIRLDAESLTYLEGLCPLAPLHQPHNLLAVPALWRSQPDLPQYACFDTAFHAGHDRLASSYALPQSLRDAGVRRFGFHGLSYHWIAHCLKNDFPHLTEGKVVAAHLGNGASLCAMQNGRSIDTTMGMTALDGLPMGTRCGSIDAGAVLFMQNELALPLAEVERLLYEESGLKGLSGLTNDVKTLTESALPDARFALDYFIWKASQHIAAMAATLGGMDALVFTGGIGENAPDIREGILARLAFLPPFETHIIAANEERGMALDIHTRFAKELNP